MFLKFRKFHRKGPVLEFLFNKVAGLLIQNLMAVSEVMQSKFLFVFTINFLTWSVSCIPHTKKYMSDVNVDDMNLQPVGE